jgi:hypothetical protein
MQDENNMIIQSRARLIVWFLGPGEGYIDLQAGTTGQYQPFAVVDEVLVPSPLLVTAQTLTPTGHSPVVVY